MDYSYIFRSAKIKKDSLEAAGFKTTDENSVWSRAGLPVDFHSNPYPVLKSKYYLYSIFFVYELLFLFLHLSIYLKLYCP